MHRLTIKIEGIEQRKKSTGMLHLAAAFLLIMEGSFYVRFTFFKELVMLPLFLVAAISLVYGLFRKNFDPVAKKNHWVRMLQFLAFVVLSILMMNIGKEIRAVSLAFFAAIVLVLLFSERKIFHNTDMLIQGDGIFVPGYFTAHHLPWPTIEEVVIRQDYITIFRKNQKYLQFELLKNIPLTELREMTIFCKQQVEHQVVLIHSTNLNT